MEYDKDILEQTGIFVFRNAISTELCARIINTFEEDKKNHKKGLTGNGYSPSVKNTTDWYLQNDLASALYSVLNLATEKIELKRPSLKALPYSWCGLQLQKNKKGVGFFKWHSDNAEGTLESWRILAPIFYLNTVAEGGHTEFMYQKYKVAPEEGTLVIFPATWEYYHRGVPPISSDKFIVTSFMISPRR